MALNNNHCMSLAKVNMGKQRIEHEKEINIYSLVSEFNVEFFNVNLI